MHDDVPVNAGVVERLFQVARNSRYGLLFFS